MEKNRLIIANWKMYKTQEEAILFLEKLRPALESTKDTIWIAPPYTLISALSEKAKEMDNLFSVGAQNMNDADEGAFTGEISARMLVDAGAKFVLLGHSERRVRFHESNEFIQNKVARALSSSLNIVLCVGESFDQNEEGMGASVIQKQLEESIGPFSEGASDRLIIAYEPLWAIGTGHVATPEIISERAHLIGETLKKKGITPQKILYGGSVTAENISTLRAIEEIDGFLVGGASLKPELFAKIVAT